MLLLSPEGLCCSPKGVSTMWRSPRKHINQGGTHTYWTQHNVHCKCSIQLLKVHILQALVQLHALLLLTVWECLTQTLQACTWPDDARIVMHHNCCTLHDQHNQNKHLGHHKQCRFSQAYFDRGIISWTSITAISAATLTACFARSTGFTRL